MDFFFLGGFPLNLTCWCSAIRKWTWGFSNPCRKPARRGFSSKSFHFSGTLGRAPWASRTSKQNHKQATNSKKMEPSHPDGSAFPQATAGLDGQGLRVYQVALRGFPFQRGSYGKSKRPGLRSGCLNHFAWKFLLKKWLCPGVRRPLKERALGLDLLLCSKAFLCEIWKVVALASVCFQKP